jgi:putative membrane protein
MYGHDYIIYLLQLMLFVVASLVLGLWARKPFKEIGHFMEKRMEDTEML